MDLEQPHSVPATFGSSTPPRGTITPVMSADDSNIQSKVNTVSPISNTAKKNQLGKLLSPRGLKRKGSPVVLNSENPGTDGFSQASKNRSVAVTASYSSLHASGKFPFLDG